MIEAVISGVKFTLRYEKGSYSCTHLKQDASDAAVYEVADAVNSLQASPAESITRTAARRLLNAG